MISSERAIDVYIAELEERLKEMEIANADLVKCVHQERNELEELSKLFIENLPDFINVKEGQGQVLERAIVRYEIAQASN